MEGSSSYTVFAGHTQLASGNWASVLTATKHHLDTGGAPVLIFDDDTGQQIDADFSGSLDDVLHRAGADRSTATPRPGRPKLGVVSREVSLLPRHWEWLQEQPNGASAALRRLVDEARKRTPRGRQLRDSAYRFVWAVAGNFENAEEAIRALYARDDARLERMMENWPSDVREHVLLLVGRAWREEQLAG